MSEPAKVRLVRCPKCENLLPEVTNYSVYQCGACGTVLRAKNRNVEAETLSEKSDEERVGGFSEKYSEKSENFDLSDKRKLKREVFTDGSDHDVKSNVSSSSRSERYRDGSMIRADKRVVHNDMEVHKNIDEYVHTKLENEFEDLRPQNGYESGSRRSRKIPDWRIKERGEMEGFRRNARIDIGDVRYSYLKYSDEGQSSSKLGCNYGYDESMDNRNDTSRFNKVEYREQDRAELLMKYDELTDKLSRSCDVIDKPKDKVAPDRRIAHQGPYIGSDNWFPDGSSGLNRASMPHPVNKHGASPPYISPYDEPSNFTSKQEMPMHNFYRPMNVSNQGQGYGDPYRSQMLRRAPNQAPGPFEQRPPHTFYSGHYMDNDMVHVDPFETYPSNINVHHPSCSCFHCYPPSIPTGFYDKRFSNVPNDSMFLNREQPCTFGKQDYNRRILNPPPINPQSHTRWSSDLNSELGGFARRRPPRVVLATGGQHCRPMAGGAPFISCSKCFELLQIPKTDLFIEKIGKKMRCGACSTVILYEVTDKRLVVSVNAEEAKKNPAKVGNRSNLVKEDGNSDKHGSLTRARMNFSSGDYDNSGYDFQSMDRVVLVSSSIGQGFNSKKSAEMKSFCSTSLYASEDEDDQNSSIAARKKANSAELPMKGIASPPAVSSPLQDQFDFSSKNGQFGRVNRIGHSEQENVNPKIDISRENSMKDQSLATEIEISSNEYSNTGTSQDSSDVSRGEDQMRANKRAQSFFAGIMKKSFKDITKSSQIVEEEIINVSVNGHAVRERLIKKAEKLAGKIHPGQYWYDFRAGFWGVMGGPCLGIIPPFIEEFNYPMPEKCGGGNTGVLVNGRELHQKDLNLLGRRGLPTDRHRSYIMEISGRILDENSGEELEGLGKLAPTVEKLKHGFGMKPRTDA